jgi:hypothetical protein
MLSADERYEDDLEQLQYLIDCAERKENRKSKRKKMRDDIMATFRSGTKS